MKIIALGGHKSSGKSEVRRILTKSYGYKHYSFAETLKNMVRLLYTDMGINLATIEEYINGHLKETPLVGYGKTTRQVMQTLGTEWGRKMFSEDVWLNIMDTKLMSARDALIVVDDVRFMNELSLLRGRATECLTVWVDKPDTVLKDYHASEVSLAPSDFSMTLHNELDRNYLDTVVEALALGKEHYSLVKNIKDDIVAYTIED
jgi:hypothetical protein